MFSGTWERTNIKIDKNLGNLKKIADLIKKMLKTIQWLVETMQCPIIKPYEDLSAPEAGKTWMTQIFKKKLKKKMRNLVSLWVFLFLVPYSSKNGINK